MIFSQMLLMVAGLIGFSLAALVWQVQPISEKHLHGQENLYHRVNRGTETRLF